MKKILIISFHSLPKDLIASYRAMAYLNHFQRFGYESTLLTHPWGDGMNQAEVKIESNENGTIIRVPIKEFKTSRLIARVESFPLINKVIILTRWLTGFFDPKKDDFNSYRSLKEYSYKHLEDASYDFIIGIFSPHHHLKLCYELHKKFNTPYILDFRDLWNNQVIHQLYNPTISEQIENNIKKHYWKKWLSKATFFSITSKDWMDKIHEFSQTKGIVVHNGFDPELFENKKNQSNTEVFTIIHGGTLYAHQKLDLFLQGCQSFIDTIRPTNFKVKFIGGDKKGLPNQLSGYMFEPKKAIHEVLEVKYCEVTKRIPKTELAREIENSQLLLFSSFPYSPGTYAGKIFDYLASGKNILMVPDDNSVVGDLIRETNTGHIANTPEEVCDYITKSYQEWQQKGFLDYHGDTEAINLYSRESQVKKVADCIHRYFKSNSFGKMEE